MGDADAPEGGRDRVPDGDGTEAMEGAGDTENAVAADAEPSLDSIPAKGDGDLLEPMDGARPAAKDAGDADRMAERTTRTLNGTPPGEAPPPGPATDVEDASEATASARKDLDGTLRSWLVLFAGFTGGVWSAALIVVWGIFQRTLIAEDFLPGATTFQLSFVGTISSAVGIVAIVFVGPLSDVVHPAILFFVGAVACAGSLFAFSYTTALWQMYLCSALFGIGGSLIYTPGLVITNAFFSRRRPFAMGVIASATGIGSFMLNPIAQACISAGGWQFSMRILALICLVWAGAAAFLLRRPYKPARSRPTFVNLRLFKNATFSLLFAAMVAIMFVLFFPSTYIPLMLFDGGYSNATGAAVVTAYSAVLAAGRILGGLITMRSGELNMFLLSCLVPLVASLLWISAPTNLAATCACSIVYGFFCGQPLVAMPLIANAEFGAESLGTVMGSLWLCFFPGEVFGNALIGLIVDAYTPYAADGARLPANYVPALGFVAGMWMLGAIFIGGLRFRHVRWTVKVKV
ncbi:major facilitator superfamily domain-containing protein [Hyaloraphidium curvatum]|nr:major facilitator superfamily domain-containing protein [Hyaloraphidium curvatum]